MTIKEEEIRILQQEILESKEQIRSKEDTINTLSANAKEQEQKQMDLEKKVALLEAEQEKRSKEHEKAINEQKAKYLKDMENNE